MARKFKSQRPREITLLVAFILWIVGVAATVLGAISLPDNYGVWSLIVAGLLLILGSVLNEL
ncbi:MAG TPA: hypothetical protein VE136_08930 [Anaerolineales bacterium]|nr:hypothetical protein [Anaerolineales bacterium]